MHVLSLKLPGFLGAGALAAALMLSGAVNTAAASAKNATCTGGSIAAGTYQSLTITGLCNVDSGNVRVQWNVTIVPGGGLNAAFSGSDLTVGHDLVVQATGLLLLGCGPDDLTCFNDSTGQTSHKILGDLIARHAKLVVVHHSRIAGDVMEIGGGGGLTCDPLFPNGPPPYSFYGTSTILGDVTVIGLRTCWDGFLSNTVWGSVTWNGNQTVIPDGNLMSTSTIHQDLNCFNNSPLPHLSDITPVKSEVEGAIRGQCIGLATH